MVTQYTVSNVKTYSSISIHFYDVNVFATFILAFLFCTTWGGKTGLGGPTIDSGYAQMTQMVKPVTLSWQWSSKNLIIWRKTVIECALFTLQLPGRMIVVRFTVAYTPRVLCTQEMLPSLVYYIDGYTAFPSNPSVQPKGSAVNKQQLVLENPPTITNYYSADCEAFQSIKLWAIFSGINFARNIGAVTWQGAWYTGWIGNFCSLYEHNRRQEMFPPKSDFVAGIGVKTSQRQSREIGCT